MNVQSWSVQSLNTMLDRLQPAGYVLHHVILTQSSCSWSQVNVSLYVSVGESVCMGVFMCVLEGMGSPTPPNFCPRKNLPSKNLPPKKFALEKEFCFKES
jgi:hypothetical protein